MTEIRIQCQRNGCTKEYLESENHDTACQFHSGAPVFHEGKKGWSCCAKRVDDFNEFLTLPGCTWSKHSSEKTIVQPVETHAGKPLIPIGAPTVSASGIEQYGHALSSAAKKAKEQQQQQQSSSNSTSTSTRKAAMLDTSTSDEQLQLPKFTEEPDAPDTVIAVGTKCLHLGCNATYKDASSRADECVFHFGQPLFHDSSKGWTCCRKRVLEFDEMFRIEGCTTGKHKFIAPQKPVNVPLQLRYDYYQTVNKLMVSIYCSNVKKDETTIKFDKEFVAVHIALSDGSHFDKRFNLLESIVPEKCSFSIMTKKVELSLTKSEPTNWDKLERPN